MDIFDLVAKLTLDSSEYEEGLQGAESSASSVGSKILGGLGKVGAGVGAVVGAVGAGVTALSGALVDGVNDLASYGDEIDKESQKLHMSAEGYQEWSAILEHSGSSISGLKMGMKTLTSELDKGLKSTEEARKAYDELAISYSNGEISIEEFEKANAELEKSVHDSLGAFGELGFSLNDVAKLAESPEDAFGQIITKLQEMDDETKRTALANDLLGRSAVELAPLLNTSAEETEEMRQRVHELGGVLSDEAVKASASFQDQLQDMQTAQQSLSRNMLSDFLPSITTVMGGLTDLFAGDNESGAEQISSGIDNIITTVTEKLPQFMNVGAEIIMNLGNSIVTNAPKILKSGISVMKELAIGLTEALPDLIDTASEIITTVIDSLSETLPELLPKLLSAVILLVSRLLDHLPEILSSLLGLVEALVDSLLTDGLPMLLRALPDIIVGVVNFIVDAIPQILNAVISIVLAIVQNLPTIITSLISALPTIITSVISALLGSIPQFIDAGIQLFIGLIGALPEIIEALIEAIPLIITGLVDAFKQNEPKIKESGKKLLESLGNGLKNLGSTIKDAVKKIWDALKNNFKSVIDNAKKWGTDLIMNFVNGIKSKISAVTDAVKNVAGKVKDFLGFSEPDEGPLSNFHTYAPDMMKLFAQGVKENTDIVTDQIAKSFDFEQPIVDVTNTDTSATMNRDTNMETVIDLLQQLVEKDPVELGTNAEGIFNLVRKKSTEYYKSNNRSAFA